MSSFKNIEKILIYQCEYKYEKEIEILKKISDLEFYIACSEEEFLDKLLTLEYDFIIFDISLGKEKIQTITRLMQDTGNHNFNILLTIRNSVLDEIHEYFNYGITNFYERYNTDFFFEMIHRMDKEKFYKKKFLELNIAILDDDNLQLRIIKDMLNRNNIVNVDLFNHPRGLLETEKKYDVYLVDLILPDTTGETVMFEIRKRNELSVIIGISSVQEKSIIAKVLSIGADDYIIKPVSEAVFMRKLYLFGKNLIIKRENEEHTRKLEKLAIRDGLTDLYNHRYVQEILINLFETYKRYGISFSVIMLDVDNFKMINDKYGHPFGDKVLKEISKKLLKSVRTADIVGRYGGEEFIIVTPETKKEDCLTIVKRIEENMKELSSELSVNVTLSGGISQIRVDLDTLIKEADEMLYKAKREGKNKIICKDYTLPI